MDKPVTSQGDSLDDVKIYETLFILVDEVLFQYKTNKIVENDITQDLEISLNEETRMYDNTPFAFQNQYQEGKFTTDIAVYIRSNRYRFCWIEAKRLPTPNGDEKRDEREYVIVDKEKFDGNGGIQRFKEGKHAKDLECSIMFGYIQDNNDADYWLSKINVWITELANADGVFWGNEDCLKKCVSSKCDRFLSVHKRKEKKPITLHHYWIKL